MQIHSFKFVVTKKQAAHLSKLLAEASDDSVYESNIVGIEVSPIDVQITVVDNDGRKIQLMS